MHQAAESFERTPSPAREVRWRFGRFRRDQKGAAAIEVAILALPFVALLFATLETALIFLIGLGLDAATSNAARLIRTGQAQEQGFNRDAFKAQICDQLDVLFTCNTSLKIDVRTANSFGGTDLSMPVVNGALDEGDFGFDGGNGSEIVVVRAFFEWPIVTRFLGEDYSTLANGNHLIVSTTAFRNEPFPW